VSGNLVQLHQGGAAAETALAAVSVYLERCKLAARTVTAYRRQCAAYVTWLAQHADEHPDAFADTVGALTAWRRQLLQTKAAASSVNQALAAVTLMYAQAAGLRIEVTRARVPLPGEPDALTTTQQNILERAAVRRGPRDGAIIAILLSAGPRVQECEHLEIADVAITARTGSLRLLGKGDQPRTVPLPTRTREKITTWLDQRGREPGPLWLGQRGPLSASGITQVVLATGEAAGMNGLRPHRLRHSYATRLRQGGADPAQIQALLGHASLEAAGRYFRAGTAETAAIVERIFD
jgi:site-specific recombinase XerD